MTFSDGQLRGLARALEGAREHPEGLLGRYVLGEKIGEGGMAAVYRGRDLQLRRPVAIKIIKERLLESVLGRRRFAREAEAVARLAHLNVITLYDAGEDDGRPFFVMEYVAGGTLEKAPREGPRWAAALMERVARGVQHAHDHGIVHRDLKPSNILLTEMGEPKVADFGLAHVETPETALTKTGATLGTPHYMAPEQVRGDAQRISTRTDVYGLGAILYQLLTDRPPHEGDTAIEIYAKIVNEEPAPIRSVPPELEAIVFRALEKSPLRRYESAGAMADDLKRFLQGETVEAKPPTPLDRLRKFVERRRKGALVAGAAFVVVLAAAVLAAIQRSRAASADEQRLAAEAQADREKLARETAELYLPLERDLDLLRMNFYRPQYELTDTEFARFDRLEDRIVAQMKKSGESAAGWRLIGRCREVRGNEAAAEDAYERALSLDPDHGPTLVSRGRLALQRAMLRRSISEAEGSGAEEAAREAAAWVERGAGDGEEEMELDLARAYLSVVEGWTTGQTFRADPWLAKWGTEPGAEEFLLIETWCNRKGGLGLLDRVMYRMPSWYRAYQMRAAWYLSHGDRDAARRDIDRALRLNPRYAASLFVSANLRALEGDRKGAMADLDEALILDPRFGEACYNRAVLRHLNGDVEGAMRDYDEAIRVSPRYAPAYHNRAVALHSRGETHAAIRDLDRAVILDPKYAEAWVARGSMKHALGDLAGAVEDYTRALETAPRDWPRRASVETTVRSLRHR